MLLQNPESRAGAAIARELSETTSITIAALLDRLCKLQEEAANRTEEQNERAREVSLVPLRTMYNMLIYIS